MRKVRLVLLTSIMAINICTLSTMTSFAAKTKKATAEKVDVLVISEAEEVEFDEPEIDDAVDAAEDHGSPLENEKKEEAKATEEKKLASAEIGPGLVKKIEKVEEEIVKEEAKASSSTRQKLVEYALKFVGGKYKFGGNTPSGFDCSGFVQYVYKNSLGKSLLRNSASQSTQGKSISADEMQVGDLLFYGNGKRINHVAMYIGNGKVVHASNERSGVKISPWNYRTPSAIRSMID